MAEEANTNTATTLQMKPVIKKPIIGGAGGLKTGLKLPPKPAIGGSPLKTVNNVASPLKPGLKLPGAPATALKPGLKLPTKPVIRKPGTGLAPMKPAAPAPAPAAAPVAAVKPVAPAAPVAKPVAPVAVAKPVAPVAVAKPVAPVAVEAKSSALGALKAVTQNLKSVSPVADVPQQAILHKTGIIADPEKALTDAQKQAAKSKTARISLSEAVGVAPVKNENAPMKTIRIKRPADIAPAGAAAPAKPVVAPVAAPVVSAPAAAPAAPAEAKNDVSVTQRKTLKVTRPAGMPVRPAGKFGVKKPGAPAAGAPAPAPAAPAAPGAAPAVADIADIPDIPEIPATASAGETVSDVPAIVGILGVVLQAAACVVIGALAWFLYQDAQIPLF